MVYNVGLSKEAIDKILKGKTVGILSDRKDIHHSEHIFVSLKTYTCPDCGSEHSSEYSLEQHRKDKHKPINDSFKVGDTIFDNQYPETLWQIIIYNGASVEISPIMGDIDKPNRATFSLEFTKNRFKKVSRSAYAEFLKRAVDSLRERK